MHSIETVVLDKYIQGICKDRSMTPGDRAVHAGTAIRVHIAQEAGYPLTVPLPIEDEIAVEMEDRLIERQADLMDNLYSASVDAFNEIDEMYPEYAGAGVLFIPEEMSFQTPPTLDGENWPRILRAVKDES